MIGNVKQEMCAITNYLQIQLVKRKALNTTNKLEVALKRKMISDE